MNSEHVNYSHLNPVLFIKTKLKSLEADTNKLKIEQEKEKNKLLSELNHSKKHIKLLQLAYADLEGQLFFEKKKLASLLTDLKKQKEMSDDMIAKINESQSSKDPTNAKNTPKKRKIMQNDSEGRFFSILTASYFFSILKIMIRTGDLTNEDDNNAELMDDTMTKSDLLRTGNAEVDSGVFSNVVHNRSQLVVSSSYSFTEPIDKTIWKKLKKHLEHKRYINRSKIKNTEKIECSRIIKYIKILIETEFKREITFNSMATTINGYRLYLICKKRCNTMWKIQINIQTNKVNVNCDHVCDCTFSVQI